MTEDAGTNRSEEPVGAANAMRQRKKRKWDEPADFLVSTGVATPGAITISNGSSLGIHTTVGFPFSNAIATNTIIPSTATIVQKLSQPKVQDELIAREIVINDAEPTIRYKLTKRQTQEEIQRSTGAVVITRGKYRPPIAFADGEKPLYLHISAGSHLKDMAERIIAVDRAAFMVEEILRQGHNSVSTSGPYTAFSSTGQVMQSMSTCVFLGFEPDPSQNIAARIRGPNDQYINHIINETGASVVLRGLGSGNHDLSHAEDAQQLHLYLSSTNPKSIEAARSLAENLLDTISAECGASRVSSSKVYGAVPPPQQLTGVQNSATIELSANPTSSSSCALPSITQAAQSLASSSLAVSSLSTLPSSGALTQNGNSITTTVNYAYPTANAGTCYSGYGGIYPQATPLQQVALALKQAPASTTPVVISANSYTNALPKMTTNLNADTEKRPPQRRKFQEVPVTSKGVTALKQNSLQGSECFKPGLKDDADTRKLSSIPLPKKPTRFGGLPPPPPRMMPPPPPPPRMMPPPPPPPKFSSSPPHLEAENCTAKVTLPPPQFPSSQSPLENSRNPEEFPNSRVQSVSDTLLKLVEYEEEDEDEVSASAEESCRSDVMKSKDSKPFWAL